MIRQSADVFVPIPVICFIRKPGATLRCTLPTGHDGDHLNVYAGATNSAGIRPGATWPRRSDESQVD